mmetsp:Transcript_39096/g.91326  ORF Transcript_39096/g.91326 Transcript_39096/m.91326 type:complete len:307 (-) Transcript_39096:76-996(-)
MAGPTVTVLSGWMPRVARPQKTFAVFWGEKLSTLDITWPIKLSRNSTSGFCFMDASAHMTLSICCGVNSSMRTTAWSPIIPKRFVSRGRSSMAIDHSVFARFSPLKSSILSIASSYHPCCRALLGCTLREARDQRYTAKSCALKSPIRDSACSSSAITIFFFGWIPRELQDQSMSAMCCGRNFSIMGNPLSMNAATSFLSFLLMDCLLCMLAIRSTAAMKFEWSILSHFSVARWRTVDTCPASPICREMMPLESLSPSFSILGSWSDNPPRLPVVIAHTNTAKRTLLAAATQQTPDPRMVPVAEVQ